MYGEQRNEVAQLEAKLEIATFTLEKIANPTRDQCPRCRGEGTLWSAVKLIKCEYCSGRGFFPVKNSMDLAQIGLEKMRDKQEQPT